MGKIHPEPETAIERTYFFLTFIFVAKCYIFLTTYCGERNIRIGPESLWTWYMGSMEGPGGRTPRPSSPWRLYRVISRGTDTSSVSPDRARHGALSRRRRTYIQVYPLHYSPRFVECPCHPTAPTLLRALDGAVSHMTLYTNRPRIAEDVPRG